MQQLNKNKLMKLHQNKNVSICLKIPKQEPNTLPVTMNKILLLTETSRAMMEPTVGVDCSSWELAILVISRT